MSVPHTTTIHCPHCNQRISVSTADAGMEAECPTCASPFIIQLHTPPPKIPGAPRRTLRIFISSPGDVADERDRARQVIESLRRRYAGHFLLKPLLWEDLPLQPDMSFQQGIDLVISDDQGADIAVFILWSRLGSPVGTVILKPDGSSYRSGTEREFDLMMKARAQSGGRRPHILIYTRDDESSFHERLRGKPTRETEDLIAQKRLVENFITEAFRDAETGTNVGAYHSFDRPVTFTQRLRTHLQDLLDHMAGGVEAECVWDIEKQGPPFMGLEAFQPCHADVFFGREEEILEARHTLREQARNGCAFLLLSGASGSGKSSLARAGVLPAIVENEIDEQVAAWRTLILTPSELKPDPVHSLIQRLAVDDVLPEILSVDAAIDDLVQGLKQSPDLTLRLWIKPVFARAAQRHKGNVRLLIVLDQLEEFFASAAISSTDCTAFFLLLEGLARTGSVWVMATARADFYHLIQNEPALVRMKSGMGQMDVLPPGPEGLRRLVEEPARLAGLRFEEREGHSLAAYIIRDAAAHAELLPLVEYVLRELYEQRTAEGVLTFAAYQALGGVEGALAQRAEQVFLQLPQEAQESLDCVLQAVITMGQESGGAAARPGDEDRIIRQRAPLSNFDEQPGARHFIAVFIGQRLFTADVNSQLGEPTITVAHEALLRVWYRAVSWADRNRDFLLVRARIAARLQEGSPLLEGDPLMDAAKIHLHRTGLGFSPEQRHYVEQSLRAVTTQRQRRERNRRNVLFGLSALSAIAFIAAVASIFLWRKAIASEAKTKVALLESERQRAVNEQALRAVREYGPAQGAAKGTSDSGASLVTRLALIYQQNNDDADDPASLERMGKMLVVDAREATDSKQWTSAQMKLAEARAFMGKRVSASQGMAELMAELMLEESRYFSNNNDLKKGAITASSNLPKVKELAAQWPSSWRLPYVLVRLENVTTLGNNDNAAAFKSLADRLIPLIDRSSQDYDIVFWHYIISSNSCRTGFECHTAQYANFLDAARNFRKCFAETNTYNTAQIEKAVVMLQRDLTFLVEQSAKPHTSDTISPRRQLLAELEATLGAVEMRIPRSKEVTAARGELLRLQEVGIKEGFNTRPVEEIVAAAERHRLIASTLGVAGSVGDTIGRAFKAYTADNASESSKASALAAAQDSLRDFLSLDVQGMDTVLQSNDINVPVGKLGELSVPDKMLALHQRMIERYADSYQKADTDTKLALLDSYTARTRAMLEGWFKAQQHQKVLAYYQASFEGLSLGAATSGDKSEMVQQFRMCIISLAKTDRTDQAKMLLRQSLAICDTILAERPWDWYLKNAYYALCFEAAAALTDAGDTSEVQSLLRRGWTTVMKMEGREDILARTTVFPLRGQLPVGASAADIRYFSFFTKNPPEKSNSEGIKRFTIPCDFSGTKYPFHVYIYPGHNSLAEFMDQVRWLKEIRGGIVPQEAVDSFNRLHKIAVENNVSFGELCVYALGTAAKEGDKKAENGDKSETK